MNTMKPIITTNITRINGIAIYIVLFVEAFTNIFIIDPILSIAVAIFIFINTLRNIKEILDLFLEKTPKEINIDEIKEHILKIKGVEDVHHIHVWSIDGFENLATMHIVSKNNKIKEKVREELCKFNIHHITIELEDSKDECNEKNCKVKSNKVNHHHHH